MQSSRTFLILALAISGPILSTLSFAQSPSEEKSNALLRAIDGAPGRLEEELLTNAAMHTRSSRGETPWCHALTMGRPDRVALLLKHGADANFEFRQVCRINAGERPIHLATIFSRPEVLQLLLENGANVNAVDGAGLTAMHYAAQNGSPTITRLLLDAGADLWAKGPDGETPHSIAISARERGMSDPETTKLINDAARRSR